MDRLEIQASSRRFKTSTWDVTSMDSSSAATLRLTEVGGGCHLKELDFGPSHTTHFKRNEYQKMMYNVQVALAFGAWWGRQLVGGGQCPADAAQCDA